MHSEMGSHTDVIMDEARNSPVVSGSDRHVPTSNWEDVDSEGMDDPQMVAVNVNDIFAYLRELESKYPINGLQSEDDLQEKIDELEIKLMRSNAVKEESEKQIDDQNKLFRMYTMMLFFHYYYHFFNVMWNTPAACTKSTCVTPHSS